MLDRIMRDCVMAAEKVLEKRGITKDVGISYYNMLQMMTASIFIEHNKYGKQILTPEAPIDKAKKEFEEATKRAENGENI